MQYNVVLQNKVLFIKITSALLMAFFGHISLMNEKHSNDRGCKVCRLWLHFCHSVFSVALFSSAFADYSIVDAHLFAVDFNR